MGTSKEMSMKNLKALGVALLLAAGACGAGDAIHMERSPLEENLRENHQRLVVMILGLRSRIEALEAENLKLQARVEALEAEDPHRKVYVLQPGDMILIPSDQKDMVEFYPVDPGVALLPEYKYLDGTLERIESEPASELLTWTVK